MIETGRGAGFAEEALARGRVGRIAHGLDGHGAMQPLVFGDVDDAHPAFAQLADDAIRADALEHAS